MIDVTAVNDRFAVIENGAVKISVDFYKLDEPSLRAIADARHGSFVKLSNGAREHHAAIGITLLDEDGTLTVFRDRARLELDRRFGQGAT